MGRCVLQRPHGVLGGALLGRAFGALPKPDDLPAHLLAGLELVVLAALHLPLCDRAFLSLGLQLLAAQVPQRAAGGFREVVFGSVGEEMLVAHATPSVVVEYLYFSGLLGVATSARVRTVH